MYKLTVIFFLTAILTFNVFSQDNWDRYAWGTPEREGFTVLLPFVPSQISGEDGEQGISATEGEEDSWHLSDSPVRPIRNSLVFNVTFQDGVGREEFDGQVRKWMQLIVLPGYGSGGGQGTGMDRATREEETGLNRKTSEVSVCGFSGIEFGNSNSVQRFFLVNNRLYHVWATGGNRSNPQVASFLDSFNLINPWYLWQGKRKGPGMVSSGLGNGTGMDFESAVCRDIGRSELKRGDKAAAAAAVEPPPASSPLRILSKPRAEYPEESKKKGVQGTVSLRVVFRGDGTVGSVVLVRGLNKELNESAARAAKLIRFEPERRAGKPVSVSKRVDYSFNLY